MSAKKITSMTQKASTLKIKMDADKSQEQQFAEISLSAVTLNAFTSVNFAKGAMGNIDITEAVNVLRNKTKQVNAGNTEALEATLTAQATSLDMIFNELARRACINMGEHLPATETYMRLALKAQAQCARTIEVLATMKNPPVVFAKQANISNGNQQVNNVSLLNSEPAHAGNTINQSNELLEVTHGSKTMDIRTEARAGDKDNAMAALEILDRG